MKKAVKQSVVLQAINIGTVVLVIIMVGMFLFSTVENSKALNLYSDETDIILAAQDFVDASQYLTEQVRSYASTGDDIYYNNYQTELNVSKNRELSYARMEEIGLSDSEIKLVKEMLSLSDELVPLETNAMEEAKANDIDSAIAFVYGDEYSNNLSKITSKQKELQSSIRERFELSILRVEKIVNAMRVLIVGIVILVLAFQAWSQMFLKKKVIRPLQMVQEELDEFAKGNLESVTDMEEDTSELGMLIHSVNIMRKYLQDYISDIRHKLNQMAGGNLVVKTDFEYFGDFAEIGAAIENISKALSRTLQEIDESSNQVAAGAEQMAIGAQALSQGSTEQAASIQELSDTAQGISEKVAINKKHTDIANTQVSESSKGLSQSSQRVVELTNAMNEIQTTSDQIKGIIKTIDDIAFQTNILALNAAVEAARAGSAGKGFAVVADEVRNLASKSAEASKNTQELIENAITAVKEGMGAASAVDTSIQEVTKLIETVVTSIEEIKIASDEQNIAVARMTQGLDQIASVVNTNSATAEESAAASEELSSQADMLKQLIGKFVYI